MAASGGAGILVRPYINGVATTIGGARKKDMKINNDTVDVTTSDSSGRWRELLGGVAVKDIEVSVSGVLQGSSVDKFIVNAVLNGSIVQTDLVVPGLGTFSGNFIYTDYDPSGDHDKEIDYTVNIRSTGVITFT